ncbi:uncharacterized protein LOC125808498 [Solanum verrucosum]|uniref:uncharacterized protein LOC125808498 n=1 Tax=Solanum verrucosum TaxID=315347 RepID=UPI0020D1D6CC|nr:uncharacterized protein LOC125808498 [Solanum verrucosum]
MERSCNASFIALIPKKKGVVELRNYRPISLIGSVYKMLAKVLAGRMKNVMNSLVSGQQSAFLRNRQITDASLIANEVLNWRMKSVLINRSPTGFFSTKKGLRQGDPLSPFLFILAIEGLSQLLTKAKELQWIQGFQVGSNPTTTVMSLTYSMQMTLSFFVELIGSILKKMDRLRRRFLWEGNILTHKYSLGKWQSVTHPKTQGGLGIRNLKLHNNNLLMKWLWRYRQTGTGFWRDVIKAKYGIQDH